MTFVEELVAALAPVGLPCAQSQYMGEAQTYLVFNYVATPTYGADDVPQYVRIAWMVHLFAPPDTDPTPYQAAVVQAIGAQYETIPSREDASTKDDIHLVFEFESVVNGDAFSG